MGSLSGYAITHPVYAVYDWFVKNRPQVDWQKLFELGLGQINHASLVSHEHPNFQIHEKNSKQGDNTRRDVYLETDRGVLHEWHLDNWQQDYFIKKPDDYRIMAHALEGIKVNLDDSAFLESERELGEKGITLGTVNGLGKGRTPLMVLQIDWVGLEKWSLDLALEEPAMIELLEIMNHIKLQEFRCVAQSSAKHIKLWENLSIETMEPIPYRTHLVPLYRQILSILEGSSKKIHVHYDGKLKIIADEIASLDLYGIDSLTEAPEGNMSIEDARSCWPDKYLWIHPNLGWYKQSDKSLENSIRSAATAAGSARYCLEISEEIPTDWERTIPLVLNALNNL
ncbi:MAG: hypothetical protein L3J79_09230 [Candidatus Marinimicrobia bacterium]|nr:hypothetical protein [Candidatus Neomarinimicrobiota bacterium]